MATVVNIVGEIQIHVDEIPDYKRDSLVAPLPQDTIAFFRLPGTEERYQEWLKDYRKRTRGKKKGAKQTHETRTNAARAVS